MTGIAAAIVFGLLGAIALYCTLDALRWRENARAMRAFSFTVLFFAMTIAAIWVGVQHPRGATLSDGFGPGWRCANLVRGDVCFRDPNAADAATPR